MMIGRTEEDSQWLRGGEGYYSRENERIGCDRQKTYRIWRIGEEG